jgi:hypothetical protein
VSFELASLGKNHQMPVLSPNIVDLPNYLLNRFKEKIIFGALLYSAVDEQNI